MKNANDPQLSEQISKILRRHNDLNRTLRDNDHREMWKILAEIQSACDLASYRILDLGGGV